MASLMDEGVAAGRLHPNVVSGHRSSGTTPTVFIVMSTSRRARWPTQRLQGSVSTCLWASRPMLDDVLQGLHAAHELRDENGQPLWVVHRDVTPHNILMGIDGVTKLTDFGVAKAATRLQRTATGLVKGKIAYMAPEQAQGLSIDRRVDVWAAGVVAWESFSGQRLHDGPNEAAILLKIVRETPTRLGIVRRDIPKPIEAVVAKALSLEVSERYPTAEVFAAALLEAGRAAGVMPASRREVQEFLWPLLSERLTARREKAREVRALRERFDELTTLDVASWQGAGSVSERISQLPERARSGGVPAPEMQAALEPTRSMDSGATLAVGSSSATRTVVETYAGSDAFPDAAPTDVYTESANTTLENTQTGTAGISTMARSIMPPRRQHLWLYAFAGAATVSALMLLLVWTFRGSAKPQPATPAPPLQVPTASTPSPADTAPGEPEVVDSLEAIPPEVDDAGGHFAPQRPSVRPRGPAAPAPRGTGVSTGPKPLGNPYKKP
ncbi:MAG: protein kinase [Polyangiaceae bacterium]